MMFKKRDSQSHGKLRSLKKDSLGFTILEIMIALSIFSFLMLYVSQFMHLEIRLFDNATRQDNLEQKARFAMMHIVDEIRTTTSPIYEPGIIGANETIGADAGIYFLNKFNNSVETCKVNINPTNMGGIVIDTINYNYIHYEDTQKKLMVKKANVDYLISDNIWWIKFEQASPRLIKISILAKNYDPSNPNDSDNPSDPSFLTVNAFQLITWVRF